MKNKMLLRVFNIPYNDNVSISMMVSRDISLDKFSHFIRKIGYNFGCDIDSPFFLLIHNIKNNKSIKIAYDCTIDDIYLCDDTNGVVKIYKITSPSELFKMIDDDEKSNTVGKHIKTQWDLMHEYLSSIVKSTESVDNNDSSTTPVVKKEDNHCSCEFENIKISDSYNNFMNTEVHFNPDVDIDVIRFISQYNNADDFQKGIEPYRGKYSYHFAMLLKSVFNRGKICYSTKREKFVWTDEDGLHYDITGNVPPIMFGGDKFVPVNMLPNNIIEVFKYPCNFDRDKMTHVNNIIKRFIVPAVK